MMAIYGKRCPKCGWWMQEGRGWSNKPVYYCENCGLEEPMSSDTYNNNAGNILILVAICIILGVLAL